jgi:hypothetical protein
VCVGGHEYGWHFDLEAGRLQMNRQQQHTYVGMCARMCVDVEGFECENEDGRHYKGQLLQRCAASA